VRSQKEEAMPAKPKTAELVISKSRTKAVARKCNVSSDFYGALDKKVKEMIGAAEKRAMANKRKTLKPQDL
jgi:histone H3/H4